VLLGHWLIFKGLKDDESHKYLAIFKKQTVFNLLKKNLVLCVA